MEQVLICGLRFGLVHSGLSDGGSTETFWSFINEVSMKIGEETVILFNKTPCHSDQPNFHFANHEMKTVTKYSP